jgi:hypothetical protein
MNPEDGKLLPQFLLSIDLRLFIQVVEPSWSPQPLLRMGELRASLVIGPYE